MLLKCPLHTLLVCSARGLSKEANHLGLRSRPRQAHHARGPSDRDTAVGAGAKDSPLAHDDALSRGQTRPREGARKDRQAARHADVTFPEGGARPARDCGQTTMKTTGARTSRQRGRRPGRARVRAPAHSAFGLLRAAPPARSRPAGRRLRQHVPDGGLSATHKAVRLWGPAYQKAPRSLGRAGAGTHWDQVFPRSLKPSNLREDGAKPVSHVSRTQARGGVMSSGCQKT